jgi:low temperature requirement protein LtrA
VHLRRRRPGGSTGWQLHPSHFAERYGLVVIIALGEAFIAIGIGATGIGIGLGEVVAAILGLLVATSCWLALVLGDSLAHCGNAPFSARLAQHLQGTS